eukprot:COSAG06_NODE_1021_length_11055_cov_7.993976_12_plen_106_part_00
MIDGQQAFEWKDEDATWAGEDPSPDKTINCLLGHSPDKSINCLLGHSPDKTINRLLTREDATTRRTGGDGARGRRRGCRQVWKTPLLRHFYTKTDHVTKTGSGQT